METTSVKALASKVLERNRQVTQVETGAINDGNFGGEKRGESFHDCFDPDGLLADLFLQGRAEGWTDEALLDRMEALRQDGTLRGPWGFKVKDSPLVGTYWIISNTTARERIPPEAISFTLAELRPIVEISRVFKGSKVVRVIEHKGKGAVNE